MSQSKFVQSADGTRIYASAQGNASNTALVFVHGFSSDNTVFNDIFTKAENTSEFFLVRYDLRGAGRSGKPTSADSYASKRFAEDFAAVAQAFHLQKPVLVGWSMGALTVNDILTYLPAGTLSGAACISSFPCFTPDFIAAFNPVVGALRAGLFSTDVATVELTSVALSRVILLRSASPSPNFLEETARALEHGTDFADDNLAVTWETRSRIFGTSWFTHAVQRQHLSTRPHDSTSTVAAGKAGFPFLVILGEKDAMLDSQKFKGVVKGVSASARVEVLAGGSHAPFLDAPEEVLGWIFSFAKGLV
ncbi:alpha/beta hydrolase [Phanerochaete sordida]|uniref:Alpha/beta hydrolase n=1 Tax=Phanerochaete sordida TaxID=48140 RepID=A0A9P3GFN5_9APHY|nr:alpha/beta hydrolase [Phanerochaete sordida]